jgi:hypothetical protein
MKAILAAILFSTATAALANCSYNGQVYPLGTRLGSLVCTPQGWR